MTDWREACHARGGVPTHDPKTGADACRLPNGTSAAGNPQWRYEPANKSIGDLFSDWTTSIEEAIDRSNGEDVARVEELVHATGLEDGATGLLAKGLGIPHWLLVGLGIFAAYAVGVSAGIVPPLRRIFK